MKEVEPLRTITHRELADATMAGVMIQEYPGHAYTDNARYAENTRHMIVFHVLEDAPQVDHLGQTMRLYLTDATYAKALQNQEAGNIKILHHASVVKGELYYDHDDQPSQEV